MSLRFVLTRMPGISSFGLYKVAPVIVEAAFVFLKKDAVRATNISPERSIRHISFTIARNCSSSRAKGKNRTAQDSIKAPLPKWH
ncbi:MAG: hypothetical protein WKF92_05705 [Pyrinomonadaceae bacterium]